MESRHLSAMQPDQEEPDGHLIVLRGNSASGKTTVAAALQESLGARTANVGQDHFRRVVLREHEVPDGDNIGLIANTVSYCVRIGYNVILEGMLRSERYGVAIGDLISSHRGPVHLFYLDVPLDETIRRHLSRPLAAEVPIDRLREWYLPLDLLGLPGETVVDGTQELTTVIDSIRRQIGALTTSSCEDPDRWFSRSESSARETTPLRPRPESASHPLRDP